MKNIKKLIACTVLGYMLLTPVSAYSYSQVPSLIAEEESKNNIALKIEDTNVYVKSFQVSLKVQGVKVESIDYSEKIKNNAKANFTDNNGIITVYVTSKVNLADENGTLDIGTLKISGKDGDEYSISPSNLKMVSINDKSLNAEKLSYEGEEKFFAATEKGSDTEKPDISEKPTVSEKPSVPGNTISPETSVVPGENETTEVPGEDTSVGLGQDKDESISKDDTKEDGELSESITEEVKESESVKENKTFIGENIFGNRVLTGDGAMIYTALAGVVLSGGVAVYIRKNDKRGKH